MAIDAQIGPHIHICMAMLGSNRTKLEPVHGKLEWAIQSHPPIPPLLVMIRSWRVVIVTLDSIPARCDKRRVAATE